MVGLVDVAHQIVVEVTRRLLDAQQEVVDVRRCALEHVLRIMHSFVSQRGTGEMKHHSECCYQKQRYRKDQHHA